MPKILKGAFRKANVIESIASSVFRKRQKKRLILILFRKNVLLRVFVPIAADGRHTRAV